MSLETRSNSALMKRAEQLKRWQDSETFREPGEPKRKTRKVGFSDGCVFLAACAAGDKGEVKVLLGRGADIDTANVDGLTALHQACIDDNLEMVEFLVEHGADVNRGDNEGWTPLHATASCGFLSIARYLLDHGANVAAVNNDGELAIDISESDEMEELLQKEIDNQKVNCEEARNTEESSMMNDARQWINSGVFGDVPHYKTGATALHVAAAKGYIKVINLLIQAGAQVNIQDYDGWTPLHAAAHWAQREACELLAENYANMDIKNCVGQTAFDVADPDVLRLLEELKKKQANLQKDRPDIAALINRVPTQPPVNKRSNNNNYNANHITTDTTNNANAVLDRSSITRLSYDDKILRTKDATVKETIQEEKTSHVLESQDTEKSSPESSDTVKGRGSQQEQPGLLVTDESGKEAVPGFSPPHPDTGQQAARDELAAAPWRRPASLRARPSQSGVASGKLSPSGGEESAVVRRAHSFGSDDKFYAKLAELRQRIRANSMPVLNQEEETNHNTYKPLSDYIYTYSLPRPAKSRLPSLLEGQESPSLGEKPPLPPKPVPSSPPLLAAMVSARPFSRLTDIAATNPAAPQHVLDLRRRVSDDSALGKQSPDFSIRLKADKLSSLQANQVRRSFVPPVRDEEHEIQRKAHAKRVRETRRSTQGVTLEDLKSAEQLVKKKQQQENAQRTTELQQLAINSSPEPAVPPSPGSTATTTVTTSATLVATTSSSSSATEADKQERRPSWRLRMESGERSRFTLEDSRAVAGPPPSAVRTATQSPERRVSKLQTPSLPTISQLSPTITLSAPTTPPLSSSQSAVKEADSPLGTPTQLAISRKKKPKRRSTGVVNIDLDDFDQETEDSADENAPSSSSLQPATDKAKKSQNGDIDYKKLWEESQAENTRLRLEMSSIRADLDTAKRQLETAIEASTKNAVSDTEKREKKMLEKKLTEMEEELKQLQKLKAENEKLKSENRALTRVVSKLTAAATKSGPVQAVQPPRK